MHYKWDLYRTPLETLSTVGNYETNINNFHNSGSMIDNFTATVVLGNFENRVGNITTMVDNFKIMKSHLETSRQRYTTLHQR
jgi:hypothetical protein